MEIERFPGIFSTYTGRSQKILRIDYFICRVLCSNKSWEWMMMCLRWHQSDLPVSDKAVYCLLSRHTCEVLKISRLQRPVYLLRYFSFWAIVSNLHNLKKKLMLLCNFDKIRFGLHFGRFFYKRRWPKCSININFSHFGKSNSNENFRKDCPF
jgi:hypothetical protein